MKKRLIALLLALLLTATGVVWAAGTVANDIANVVYTQQILSGDPAAAAGITLQHKVQHRNYLHWDTVLTFGEDGYTTDTTFTYTPDRTWEESAYEHEGVMMWLDASADYNLDIPRELHEGFDLVMYDLYMETAKGETKSRTVRLSDCYEYYPIDFQVDLPGHHFYSDERIYWYSNADDAYNAAWKRVDDGFREFFRIPSCTDEEYGLYLTKSTDGGMHYSSGLTDAAAEAEQYYVSSYAVSDETGIWFTFSTHTTEGNVVDTSLIPGGYGIYYLPIREVEVSVAPCDGIMTEELRCIYPMDPAVEVKSLSRASDGSLLVSYETDDGSLWVDVVDPKSGAQRQTMKLCAPLEDAEIWVNPLKGDNCIVYFVSADRVIVLEEADNGIVQRLNVPMERLAKVSYGYYDSHIGWDGTRLVMTCPRHEGHTDTDLVLSVYTAEGLQFTGAYACSLTQAYSNYNNYNVDGYPKVVSMK